MKKFFLLLIAIIVLCPVILIAGLWLTWSPWVEPKIRSTIVKSLEEKGFSIKMSPIELEGFGIPLKLRLVNTQLQSLDNNISFKLAQGQLEIRPHNFSFSLKNIKYSLAITLEKPVIEVKQEASPVVAKKEQKAEAESGPAAASGLPIHSFSLMVVDGQLNLSQMKSGRRLNEIKLQRVNVKVEAPHLFSNEPVEIGLESQLQYQLNSTPVPLSGDTPLKILSKSIILTQNNLKISNLNIDLGGLQVIAKLNQNIQTENTEFALKGKVDSLVVLQKKGLLPEGQWSGGLDLNLKGQMLKSKPLQVDGNFKFKKVIGRLQKPIEKESLRLAGAFLLNGGVDFSYQDKLKKLNSDFLADFSKLSIYLKPHFYKKSNLPFKFRIKSKLEGDKVNLTTLKMELAQIKANVAGTLGVNPGSLSKIQFSVKKTSLAGMENIFLMLKKYPVRGTLAAVGVVEGDFSQPEKLKIQANPFSLNVSSGLNYSNEDKTLKMLGPFRSVVDGRFDIYGEKVLKANLTGNVDLTAMSIEAPGGFNKRANQKMHLSFAAMQKGEQLFFKNFTLKSFFGELSAQGELSSPLKPKIKLSGEIKNLNLESLKSLSQSFASNPIPGIINSRFKLWGSFDPKLGVEKSPLRVSGKVLHNSSILKWSSPKSEAEVKKTAGNKRVTKKDSLTPLIPEWPIVKNSKFQLVSRIKNVDFNGLKVQDFSLDGVLNQGKLTGEVSAKKIFSGSLSLKNISADLYKVPTFVEGRVSAGEVNIESAMIWGFPDHKDLLKGSLTGVFDLKAPFPSHADPIKKSESSGQLVISGFEVSTIKLDHMINGLLAKIPGLKDKKKIRTEKVKALFKTKYRLINGDLFFSETDFLTPENHQLLVSGKVNYEKELSLKGKIMVSGVRVQETIATCFLDSQQRLPVPIEYHGLITQPKMTYATKAIAIVGKKYLQCESQYQIKKVKSDIKIKADETLKKQGKKLEEDLKKKFKKIF